MRAEPKTFTPPHIARWHARRARVCRLCAVSSTLAALAAVGLASLLLAEARPVVAAFTAALGALGATLLGRLARRAASHLFDRRIPFPEALC